MPKLYAYKGIPLDSAPYRFLTTGTPLRGLCFFCGDKINLERPSLARLHVCLPEDPNRIRTIVDSISNLDQWP